MAEKYRYIYIPNIVQIIFLIAYEFEFLNCGKIILFSPLWLWGLTFGTLFLIYKLTKIN